MNTKQWAVSRSMLTQRQVAQCSHTISIAYGRSSQVNLNLGQTGWAYRLKLLVQAYYVYYMAVVFIIYKLPNINKLKEKLNLWPKLNNRTSPVLSQP